MRIFKSREEGQSHPATVSALSAGSLAHPGSNAYRIEDFSSLGARLDSIDQTLANLTQAFFSTDQTSHSASRASEVDDLDLFVRRPDSESSDQDTTISQQGEILPGIHQKIRDCGSEQYYGSTSALCLVLSSRRVLGEILGANQAKRNGPVTALATKVTSLRTELQHLYDSFPFVNSCREPNFSSDGKAVSSPPRSFIDTVVDCFLSNINSTRPIFQESRLKSAIEHNDSGQVSESMEGRDLCFSNIILLTLDLKSRLARRSHSKGNGMDEDLLMSFWKNSQRAFGHLSTYLEPRLVNVQALATLVSFQNTISPPLVACSFGTKSKQVDTFGTLCRPWLLENTVRARCSNGFATWRVLLQRAWAFIDYPVTQMGPRPRRMQSALNCSGHSMSWIKSGFS